MIKKLRESYIAVGDHVVYDGINYTVVDLDDESDTATLRPDTEVYNPDTFEGNSFFDITVSLSEL